MFLLRSVVLLCLIGILKASSDDDDDDVRSARHLSSKHHSIHHSSHVGHHHKLGHHGHSHHSHKHIHKVDHKHGGHLKVGTLSLHHVHGRSVPHSQHEEEHDSHHHGNHNEDQEDVNHNHGDVKSHFSAQSEFHLNNGQFTDVWSKNKKSNVFHSEPQKEKVHKAEVYSMADPPCKHKEEHEKEEHIALHENKHEFEHSEQHHHSPPSEDVHSSSHQPHHTMEKHPFGHHKGHGIVIQKQLSIKKFRSSDEDPDNTEDDARSLDHVDENGIFGRKP